MDLFRHAALPLALHLKPIAAHLGAMVCYALAHTSLMWGSRLVLFPLLGLGRYDYGTMPTRYFMEFPSQFIYYVGWLTAHTVYRNWLRTKDLEKELVAARLTALTHRLQPHFLFNALNAVSAAIYEDPHRADKMLEAISGFLRATLKVPDAPMVPLSAEFGLARRYLEVMKTRLEDRLQFEIEYDADLENAQVPALLLQPLVENAIEHGQDPVSGRVDISVEAAREDTFLTISIRDRGRGFGSDASGINGHGLSNARQRLKTVYRDHGSLDLVHDSDGTCVRVRIPI
jgi:LytS/YehU family sensor histidine kinase